MSALFYILRTTFHYTYYIYIPLLFMTFSLNINMFFLSCYLRCIKWVGCSVSYRLWCCCAPVLRSRNNRLIRAQLTPVVVVFMGFQIIWDWQQSLCLFLLRMPSGRTNITCCLCLWWNNTLLTKCMYALLRMLRLYISLANLLGCWWMCIRLTAIATCS